MKKLAVAVCLSFFALSTQALAQSDICYANAKTKAKPKHTFYCENMGAMSVQDIEKKGYKIKEMSTLPGTEYVYERIIILISND